MSERLETKFRSRLQPTEHRGLYPVSRVRAMGLVAKELRLPFMVLRKEGQKYYDKDVPDKMAYVSIRTKDKANEFWKKVDEIAAPPTPEEIASGAYLR